MEDIFEKTELYDCPDCGGAGILEEEKGAGFYCACLECGAVTVTVGYSKPEDRESAAERAAYLWNVGKVISPAPGERVGKVILRTV